jgi:hypothetical protein
LSRLRGYPKDEAVSCMLRTFQRRVATRLYCKGSSKLKQLFIPISSFNNQELPVRRRLEFILEQPRNGGSSSPCSALLRHSEFVELRQEF